MASSQHTFGLCVYGIQYLTVNPKNPSPLDANRFADLAAKHGLSTLEVSLSYVSPELDPNAIRDYASRARDRGMQVVVAGPNLSRADDVERQLELAADAGASVFRCV
ncbi:MAG: hypothetical protein ACOC0E_13880, partial [Spirochaetota bacterium]